jgi:DNA topoisomerase-1
MRRAKQAKPTPIEIVTDPIESAKSAGLRYVTDAKPGIRRLRRGKTFRYQSADGTPVHDKETLARIKSLVIPPAWNDVWICPIPNGHLQATGRDAKGRKQSRYHPRWRQVRDETKYERMMLFGTALPAVRERVEQDLALANLPRPKILATIVRLMETTFIRVGNEEYAHSNHSYGLTTMRNRHVAVRGSTLRFNFTGKSGVQHAINLTDRRLARIVKRSRDLPGYELFQYLDDDGTAHSIDSADVNDYLREITPQHVTADFTAKDFRTWAGSVLACAMLKEFGPVESESQAKKNIVEAIKSVASRLGNTPSVCRKCYVHPAVLDSYLGGQMMKALEAQVKEEIAHDAEGLREEERALMRLLHQRLSQPSSSQSK